MTNHVTYSYLTSSRYLGVELTSDNNITTGKIYKQVIERERRGAYLGRTVQVGKWLLNNSLLESLSGRCFWPATRNTTD